MTLYQPNMPASIAPSSDEKDLYPQWVEDKLLVVNEAQTKIWIDEELGLKLVTPDISTVASDVNNIPVDGTFWAGYTVPNVPTLDNFIIYHRKLSTDNGFASQLAHNLQGNRFYMRGKYDNVWGSWREIMNETGGTYTGSITATDFLVGGVSTRNQYITPSDNVLLSLPTERISSSGTLKTIKFNKAGKYRLKGEYRSQFNGNNATADFRFGIASAGNLTPDGAGSLSTTSATYAPFSIDLTYVPENCTMIIYANGGEVIWIKNVTVCGTLTYANPNTTLTGTD